MNGIAKLGDAVQVIREPITAGNKVIIPAVVAHIGVGAGGGSGRRETAQSEGGPRTGSGGGGGGGMTLSPVFLIVDEQGERLITVPTGLGSASAVVEKLSEVAGSMFARKRGEKATPDAVTP
jgi:uncharacterized spore protein YtfJ